MSTTTKEMPTPSMVNAGPDGARRTDAVGAEIPVIVHASRYSAAKGVGKQLPAVHEETRTVIVFPQGAVVRLTANMMVGELVVLTNRQTGADALCRVVNVKTQPGIQNYVNLEFTQRAPGFWGECIQGDRSELPLNTTLSPAAPSSFSPQPAEPMPPARDLLTAVAPEPGFKPTATPRGTVTEMPSPKPAPRVPQSQNWTRTSSEQVAAPSSTKKMVLIAAVAAVLVGVGIGAGMLVLRQNRATGTQQAVANVSNPVATTPAADPAVQPQEVPQNVAVTQPVVSNPSDSAAVPATSAVEATRTVAKNVAPKAAAPAAGAVQPAAPNMNVGKISAPIARNSARVAANDAPPVVGAQASLGSGSLTGGLLESTANPAAPPPVLARGGVIQQPKLISSVSAVYPTAARSAHIQGDVVVDATVDATGKVTSVKAVSGPLLLQQSALDAVRTWKYQPAELDGKPIEVHTQVSLTFRLQ